MKKILEQQIGYTLNRLKKYELMDLNNLPQEIIYSCRKLDENVLRYYFLKQVMG